MSEEDQNQAREHAHSANKCGAFVSLLVPDFQFQPTYRLVAESCASVKHRPLLG